MKKPKTFMNFDVETMIAEAKKRESIRRDFVARELKRPEAFADCLESGHPVRFNMTSLPGWIRLAEMAGIPSIPYRTLGSLPVADYWSAHDDPETDFDARTRAIAASLREDEILRFEHVAPMNIKRALSTGQPIVNGLEPDGSVDLYDVRFADTVHQLNETDIRFLARPLIEPLKAPGLDGNGEYPLEMRVFVQGGQLIGLSNYYPQMRMTRDHHHFLRRALEMSAGMLSFMREHDIAPANPSFSPHPEGPSFTLDFLIRKDGELLFLEGGPPGLQAAHPCCFLTPDHDAVRGEPPLHGLALAVDAEILPLDDIHPDSFPDLVGMAQPFPDFSKPDDPSPA